ncbi:MAG TPA: alpha/beta fold hydrolase [Acidimicrobiia bacterium]
MTPIEVDSGPIGWREAGSGPVVVFLHGLGGSRIAWEPQLRDLSDGWRCVAWDMPGYGVSGPFPGEMTWEKASAAVVELLGLLGVNSAHLVGMSLGGMVALNTALMRPDHVRSLILLATSPAFGLNGVTTVDGWKAERLAPLSGAVLGDVAPRILRTVAGPQAPESVIVEASRAMARISPEGFRAAVECLPSHDLRRRLDELHLPCLVMVGDLDRETPPSYAQYLRDHIPGARLAVIAGAGHLVNLEQPHAVNERIRRFLAELERGIE